MIEYNTLNPPKLQFAVASKVTSTQTHVYTPGVQWVLQVALSALAAPIKVDDPAALTVDWNALRTETEAQKTANLSGVATATSALIIAGVISPDEGRGHRIIRSEYDIPDDEVSAEEEGEEFGAPALVPDVPDPTASDDPPVVVASPSAA